MVLYVDLPLNFRGNVCGNVLITSQRYAKTFNIEFVKYIWNYTHLELAAWVPVCTDG